MRVESSRGPVLTMASTRTYESALNTECGWKELGTYLDGVLVGEEVDDLERVRDNADGQELLAVVAALHHQAVCYRVL